MSFNNISSQMYFATKIAANIETNKIIDFSEN